MTNDDFYAPKPGDLVSTGNITRKENIGSLDAGAKTYKIVAPILDNESTGLSFEAVKLDNGKDGDKYFIKMPKLKRGASDSETYRYLVDILLAFSNEYRNRDRFADNINVAKVEGFGIYEVYDTENRRNLPIPFLVQEFVEGQTLIEYLASKRPPNTEGPSIREEKEFFKLAKEIVRAVKRIHNQQVIHGDIRPKNIRLQMKGEEPKIRIVGFNRSFLLDQSFQTSGGGAAALHRYRAPECAASNDYWYTPADIYSLGCVLHYIATEQDPPPADTEEKALKNAVLQSIKSANEALYKQNEGIVKIIDKCLRFDPEERYPHAESVISALQTFDYSYHQEHINVESLKSSLRGIEENAANVISKDNAFFANIILQKLSLLKEDVDSIANNHYEIYGAREDIIDSLVRYLSVLEPGDQYLTVTKPAFWAAQNLGINGRFLTMNKVMATKGVTVRRVFLLTEDEILDKSDPQHDPEIYEILDAHKQATKDMEEVHGMNVTNSTIPSFEVAKSANLQGSFYTGFRVLSQSQIEEYERQVSHVALWRKPNGDQMSILFISRPTFHNTALKKNPRAQKGDRIVKVRFWKSGKQDGFLKEIEQHLDHATPIKELWKDIKPVRRRRTTSNTE